MKFVKALSPKEPGNTEAKFWKRLPDSKLKMRTARALAALKPSKIPAESPLPALPCPKISDAASGSALEWKVLESAFPNAPAGSGAPVRSPG